METETRAKLSKALLAVFFGLFLLLLYGPIIVMAVLSLQDGQGGATFPAHGLVNLYWYDYLFGSESADIHEAAVQSLGLALVVSLIVGALSLTLAITYRRLRRLSGVVLYLVLLSLMTPGILLGLGMTIWWNLLGLNTEIYPTVLGVQVVWALPFGFLVMVAIFGRYDVSLEESAYDLGATPLKTFTKVTLPIVWTGIFAAALLGFTLSWNEFERTLLISPVQTLPLEIYASITVSVLEPSLYALGVLTTAGTLLLVMVMLVGAALWARRTTKAQLTETLEEGIAEESLLGLGRARRASGPAGG